MQSTSVGLIRIRVIHHESVFNVLKNRFDGVSVSSTIVQYTLQVIQKRFSVCVVKGELEPFELKVLVEILGNRILNLVVVRFWCLDCLDCRNRHHFGLIKHPQDVGVGAVLLAHRPQEHGDRELPALVDAHSEDILLGHVHLDPTATLRDYPTGVQLATTGVHLHKEIDSRRPVQLTDNNPLGTVDDELATTHHDGKFTEVNILLDGFILLVESGPDAEGPAVAQPELATLIGRVSGFAEFVVDVLQRYRTVVTLDGECIPEDVFQTFGLAFFGRDLRLKKLLVRLGLDVNQIRQWIRVTRLAETACTHTLTLANRNGDPPRRTGTESREEPCLPPRRTRTSLSSLYCSVTAVTSTRPPHRPLPVPS